jgi:hypothetical protein
MHLLADMNLKRAFPYMTKRKHHLHLSFFMLKILLGLSNRAGGETIAYLYLVISDPGNNTRNKLNKYVFLIFRNITNLCKTRYIHLYRFRFESISPVKKKKSERLAHSSHNICIMSCFVSKIVCFVSI